jgi:hypothetical protein
LRIRRRGAHDRPDPHCQTDRPADEDTDARKTKKESYKPHDELRDTFSGFPMTSDPTPGKKMFDTIAGAFTKPLA